MANRVNLSVESRIRGDVYVRFGGRFSEIYRSNAVRRRVPSLHGVFDIEKWESIKTLILTLWKRDDEVPSQAEEVALSNALSGYIELIKSDDSIKPSFNTFYEFVKANYRKVLIDKNVRKKDFDIDYLLKQ